MDAHYWLFPWLSLFASLAAGIGAFFLIRHDKAEIESAPITPWIVLVWLAAIAIMVVGGLKIGDWAAVDYIPARGILAGAVGGLILSFILRIPTISIAAKTAALFGFSTALVCAARLWLTHGEISGLIATAFSAGATILCFVAAPAISSGRAKALENSSLTLLTITALASAALLGFTRTDTLGSAYWADIPLMIGGALSVGLFAAILLSRFGAFLRATIVIVTVLIVTIPLAVTVAHLLPVIGLTVLGIITVGLPQLLVSKKPAQEMPVYLGLFLIVAGVTVAFTLLSGYGVALFTIGGLVAASIGTTSTVRMPISWLSFSTLLLVYRLEVLQNGSSVRAIGPADMWDLLAITLGLLLPKIIASWIADYAPNISWATTLQWLLAIAAPTLVLDYIWQPRTLTGLFLGLSIGQLAIGRRDSETGEEVSGLTALLVALLLFLFLPGLDELATPSRDTRIVCVVVLAVIAAVRILIPNSLATSTKKAA